MDVAPAADEYLGKAMFDGQDQAAGENGKAVNHCLWPVLLKSWL